MSAIWRPDKVNIHVSAAAGAEPFHVVAVPVISHPQLPEIYEYLDHAYPTTAASSQTSIHEIGEHLSAILKTYGMRIPVHVVDAAELANLLGALSSASHRLLILASGDLPSSVWTDDSNLVGPWMQAGGTVVWAGDAPGYYSVGKTASFTLNAPVQETVSDEGCLAVQATSRVTLASAVSVLADSGVERFLGQVPRGSNGRWPLSWTCVASQPTNVARALGLQYESDHDGLPLAFIDSNGGLPLGFIVGEQASLSYVPEGRGRLLLFGGPTNGSVIAIATDTARVVLSGVMNSTGQIVWRTLYGRADVEVSIGIATKTKGLQLTFLDPSANGVYLHTEFISSPLTYTWSDPLRPVALSIRKGTQ